MRRVFLSGGVVAALLAFLAWLDGPVSQFVLGLALGWLAYPVRVFPRVRVDGSGLATAALCLALFTFGLDRTLKWLRREVRSAGGEDAAGQCPWALRWTCSLVVLILVMFVAGVAASGVVHQAGWLIASRRNLVERQARIPYGSQSSPDRLKEIGLGAYMFATTRGPSPRPGPGPAGGSYQSWMTDALPYTTFGVGGELRPDLPWNDPRNSAYFKGIVPPYLNPEVAVFRNPDGYALSHYAGNVHLLGRHQAWLGPAEGDASNTILAGEVAEGFKPWGDPTNLRDPGLGVNTVPAGFGGPSGTGAHFVFADGSVRFLRATTPRALLRHLSMPKPADR